LGVAEGELREGVLVGADDDVELRELRQDAVRDVAGKMKSARCTSSSVRLDEG